MSINTPKFKAGFPNLLKAKRNELNGKDEYSVVALFPKGTDMTAMQKAAQAAIVAKWGEDKTKWPKNLKSPFRKHEEKEKVDEKTGNKSYPPGFEEGGIFINLKSANKPQCVERNSNGDLEEIIDSSKIYGGCILMASVNAFAYDQLGNKGVSFGLNNILKVSDGERFGGKNSAADDFAQVATGPVNKQDVNSLFND